ncbi:hypothetical protein JTB14_013378 [Gonioctena quinquepunctata]|nr:hypothetical protein JTB14_013378 [Gonioctena quinquepunctata]
MKSDFDEKVTELHIENEEQGETYKDLVTVIQNKLINVNINTIDIRDSHRIGEEGPNKIRPVLVEFTNSQKKYEILHNANKLKNSGISISVDLIAKDYEKKQFMVNQLKTARQKQFNAKYKGNNLLINDTEYTYENLKQNPVENWTVRNGTGVENSSRKRTNEIEMENQEGNAKKYITTRSASRNN